MISNDRLRSEWVISKLTARMVEDHVIPHLPHPHAWHIFCFESGADPDILVKNEDEFVMLPSEWRMGESLFN